jgi:hypothetical protein
LIIVNYATHPLKGISQPENQCNLSRVLFAVSSVISLNTKKPTNWSMLKELNDIAIIAPSL